MKPIYLDYAAATPVDRRVLKAMEPYFSAKFHNPSATYLTGKSVKKDLEQARETVAKNIGSRPSEVIFTAGGTEANNLAIKGVLLATPGSHVVTTALEHDSIRMPLAYMENIGFSQTEITPRPNGIVDPDAVVAAVTDKTVLVSVMYANNEIGTVQPVRQIAEKLAKIRKERKADGNDLPLYFHTDACQAANYLDVHAKNLGVDMMTLNGGKIYGPKQSGILYASSNARLIPLVHGGGQEMGMRSGTENTAACIGFARALDIATAKRKSESERMQNLQKLFVDLISQKIPSAQLNGSRDLRLPNNVHVTIPGIDNERIIFALDEFGIQCAAGSACSASSAESSHVLKSLGMSDDEARSSLRFSMGRETTESEIKQAVKTLEKLTH